VNRSSAAYTPDDGSRSWKGYGRAPASEGPHHRRIDNSTAPDVTCFSISVVFSHPISERTRIEYHIYISSKALAWLSWFVVLHDCRLTTNHLLDLRLLLDFTSRGITRLDSSLDVLQDSISVHEILALR
jgi:hypothetical protein